MALLEEFWHWRLALRFQKLMPVPASVFVPVFVTISLSLLISQCFSLFLYISVYTLTVSVSASVCLSVCLSVFLYLSLSSTSSICIRCKFIYSSSAMMPVCMPACCHVPHLDNPGSPFYIVGQPQLNVFFIHYPGQGVS